MKYAITTIATLFIICHCYCQDFPGNDVYLLTGKELRVKPKDKSLQPYGFEGFYKNDKMKQVFACCSSYNSKYESLVDKVFKVVDIVHYESLGRDRYKLKLSNVQIGEVYFDYEPEYEFKFPFEVIGGIKSPEGYYCKDIEKTIDKFTNDTTYMTSEADGIRFLKIKKSNLSGVYVLITHLSSAAEVGKKGVILLLENNLKIEKPDVDINVKLHPNGKLYVYSASFPLSDVEVKILQENQITDSRLYLTDSSIKYGKKLLDLMKCIASK